MGAPEASTLIANAPKFFILSQFKPAYSPKSTDSTQYLSDIPF